jgi:hypothetical protein
MLVSLLLVNPHATHEKLDIIYYLLRTVGLMPVEAIPFMMHRVTIHLLLEKKGSTKIYLLLWPEKIWQAV